ncbi:helix-turn-helix transcriptional regulator [Pacificibacter marinus]|uniref:HTH luxR-type domain-containing protein n=1 Tax=Pacificibacter marinus TaxID=658057 RepID=A0A1Y5SXM5_9RHOB|nr:hypothetical protein [Pacificibacter marinus]SEL06235.1 hypothetical protein SAMN04488032_110146 [Pacificibacter marinus]SLN51053.1 hypothetical protein PAM7971_02511 [Pacificibacter marinus]
MSDETQLLTALFTAALGQAEGTQNAIKPDPARSQNWPNNWPNTWNGFLTILAQITHADTVQLHLIENGRVQHWQVGDDLGAVDIAASDRMRTSRVYSQSDFPSDLKLDFPLRAIRWRNGNDAWGILTLRRRADDFRAIDGQHLSNLLPYLAPAVRGWQSLTRDRAQADIAHQICANLGAGWILFAPTGQVTAMAVGLAARLEVAAGIKLSADGRLRLAPTTARNLRDVLNAMANGSADPHSLWLSTSPRVQMILTTEQHAGIDVLVGRVRHDVMAGALPLSRIMTAFDLNRSEARLAAALCDGLSLSDAAQTLDWTLETARSTSKQIFAHMGVAGQPGVVRVMQASAIWLHPTGKYLWRNDRQ